ncbi:AraC family transcriptional regulator [Pedobacter arcticus]|uniref:AraC family transcriptional regulator n=1 Tax=Pedobacter arcticus TaxID=752140 RepID=UPI000380A33E|nr:AraC family transcriptional regulator [Pedobacter arcticus]
MKPQLLKIPLTVDQSFRIKTDMSKKFYNQWHYHPEIELVLIVAGSGTVLVGDGILNIRSGDLLLIGANLPHMFRSDVDHDENKITETLTIHFLPELFEAFLALPENDLIAKLLEKASVGISVLGETKSEVATLMQKISYVYKTQRLISLLEILNKIASSAETNFIATKSLKLYANKQDETRLNRIYQYTLNNFARKITLAEIANVVHMVPHSFCRYFKSRTNKRYSLFLLEVRIGHACKLLTESDYSIAVIAYESGFMNASNFNRHFKLITNKTPFEYKKQFQMAYSAVY